MFGLAPVRLARAGSFKAAAVVVFGSSREQQRASAHGGPRVDRERNSRTRSDFQTRAGLSHWQTQQRQQLSNTTGSASNKDGGSREANQEQRAPARVKSRATVCAQDAVADSLCGVGRGRSPLGNRLQSMRRHDDDDELLLLLEVPSVQFDSLELVSRTRAT